MTTAEHYRELTTDRSITAAVWESLADVWATLDRTDQVRGCRAREDECLAAAAEAERRAEAAEKETTP